MSVKAFMLLFLFNETIFNKSEIIHKRLLFFGNYDKMFIELKKHNLFRFFDKSTAYLKDQQLVISF